MLFRSASWGRFIVKMVGLLYFSVFERMPCFASVELIILNVSRYVMRSVFRCVRCARLDWRLVAVCLVGFGVRTVTSLAMAIIYSMPHFQLALTLLMRRRAVGVRGIRSSSFGGGVVVWLARYSVVVILSRSVRCCDACCRWCCTLGLSCVTSSALCIFAWVVTSLGSIPSVCGVNSGGVKLFDLFGYVLMSGICATR